MVNSIAILYIKYTPSEKAMKETKITRKCVYTRIAVSRH